jgi:hypothetical protein
MHNEGDEIHVSEEEASGGSKEGVVRWVLIGGLVLAIGALSLIWIFGAASRSDPDADHANVSRQIAAEEKARAEREGIDSIVAPPSDPTAEQTERAVRDGEAVIEN